MMQPGANLHRLTRRSSLAAALALLGAVAGCTKAVPRPSGATGVAPMLSVERFLQASNARDYEGMARLFGDANGPVADRGSTLGCAFKKMGDWVGMAESCRTREEVELWMAAIAQILRHQDYRIATERQEPGRRHLTNRIGVDITREGSVVRDVPFLVVRTSQGGWLIQQIDLEKVMGS